ncbi:MAG: non-canonical purine NTP pyrophosphatase [Deltaproteobacteria bacterium]|nr:MAG: non-canonical purine NTP pyrophosphatase [Deltaproteobacteria bacterium]
MKRTLVVATGNPHKRAEIAAMLEPYHVAVTTAREHGLGDVEETGATFEENALLKAIAGFRHTGLPCLADDSGLLVDALDGAPGVYSARYAGADATDADNNALLISRLVDVPAERRGARFASNVALVLPAALAVGVPDGPWRRHDVDAEAVAFTVEGTVPGRIIDDARGAAGFGYDPHFLYEPAGRTFAELASHEKHAISHRGQAMAMMGELFRAVFGHA